MLMGFTWVGYPWEGLSWEGLTWGGLTCWGLTGVGVTLLTWEVFTLLTQAALPTLRRYHKPSLGRRSSVGSPLVRSRHDRPQLPDSRHVRDRCPADGTRWAVQNLGGGGVSR